MQIRARINSLIKQFLEEEDQLWWCASMHNGPVHIIFPQIMRQNIEEYREIFSKLSLDFRIFFSHKPTKSIAFVRQAVYEGIDIDVSSESELISALSAGFTGDRISCLGTKSAHYLYLAIKHGCIISVDSTGELERLISINKKLNCVEVPVMVRVHNPVGYSRGIKPRTSKFGVDDEDLDVIYGILGNHQEIKLKGFHYHHASDTVDMKSSKIDGMIKNLERALELGFEPDTLNIGGSYRIGTQLEDYNEWSCFLDTLSRHVQSGNSNQFWGSSNYGMSMDAKGTVAGRERVESRFPSKHIDVTVPEILSNSILRNVPLCKIISDSLITVAMEPGYSLIYNCGISVLKVIDVKHDRNGNNIITTNGNILNMGARVYELLTEPLLITRDKDNRKFEAFVAGNMCREDDMLVKRKIHFEHTPSEGDILVFYNTAAYSSDFEEASPHQHPAGIKLVAHHNESWNVTADYLYNPYLI